MYEKIGNFTWSKPDFIVNRREEALFRALHIVAGKHGDYQGAMNIMLAFTEPHTQGEWRDVLNQ